MFAPEDKKKAGVENLVNNILPAALKMIDKLMCGTKYICGDTITQYDFQVAGVITNFGMYNEMEMLRAIKHCLIKHGSDHMKMYVRCFAAEMGDYMEKRGNKHGKIRLYYFDMMGRAEPLRMLLEHSGIHW